MISKKNNYILTPFPTESTRNVLKKEIRMVMRRKVSQTIDEWPNQDKKKGGVKATLSENKLIKRV